MAGIEGHVTCSICMDLYNDPLALPCLHSFCRHCIEELFSSSLTFKCPECRVDVNLGRHGVDELPKNFQLAGIVESYRRQNGRLDRTNADGPSGRIHCAQHNTTCEIVCTTCAKTLCLTCLTKERHSKRHKLKLLNTTIDKKVSNFEATCPSHHRQQELFCCDCENLVCLECITKDHTGHYLASINETYEYNVDISRGTLSELDARSRLLKATQNTCRMLAHKAQADAHAKRQEVGTYFSRLREALDKKESQVREQLDRRENDVVQTYMTKADDVRRKEKLVCDATDDVKALLKASKSELLKQYRSKTSRVSDLLTDEHTDSPPRVRGFEGVSLLTCSLEKELTNIAWQWPTEEPRPMRKAPPVPAERKKPSLAGKLRPQAAARQPQTIIKTGTPVSRGKDWHAGTVDGGPGHIGTITAVEMNRDFHGCAICTVRWPNGKTGQYTFHPPSVEEISPV